MVDPGCFVIYSVIVVRFPCSCRAPCTLHYYHVIHGYVVIVSKRPESYLVTSPAMPAVLQEQYATVSLLVQKTGTAV